MLNYAKVESVQEVFTREFYRVLINEKKKNNYKQIALLCIGTDKMTGDCFGPLVGTKLMQLLEDYNIYNVNIYGSLEKNINYTNILDSLSDLYETSWDFWESWLVFLQRDAVSRWVLPMS